LAGFGTEETRGAIARLYLRIHHDEDAEVFLNGTGGGQYIDVGIVEWIEAQTGSAPNP